MLWILNTRTGLNTAILDHGGEAGTVIGKYKALSLADQSNLLAFLSSL